MELSHKVQERQERGEAVGHKGQEKQERREELSHKGQEKQERRVEVGHKVQEKQEGRVEVGHKVQEKQEGRVEVRVQRLFSKTFAIRSYFDSVVLWCDFTPFGSRFASASAANCPHVWSVRLPVHIFCESVCNAG